MSATGSTQERPTVQDEEQSQTVHNLKDGYPNGLSNISDEKTSTKNTLKLMAIPLELVLIPVTVFRPQTKKCSTKPKNEYYM
ncbi:unnamed protein product [Macrosiphum euphorbiae]|uniref:Uncharacterized protein n=1 Tax=Macrosiphum euphorbiae TaxID=13131 RepID=A0AAV0W4J6_9HEMI|nr:unnamed protein product [Macrosiphum euphorbiae]